MLHFSPGLGDGREEATEEKDRLFRAGFFSDTGVKGRAKFRIDVPLLLPVRRR